MVQACHHMSAVKWAVAVLANVAKDAYAHPPVRLSFCREGLAPLVLLTMVMALWIEGTPRPLRPLRKAPRLKPSVFGADDRTELNTDARPWAAVGRIDLLPRGISPLAYQGNVAFCTGSLVAKDLVVTNAHCVLDGKTNALTKQVIWFRPGYRLGEVKPLAARVQQVWLGSMLPDHQRSQDWAILKLDEPLGEEVGWFDVQPLTRQGEHLFPHPATFVGYAMDYRNGNVPVTHVACNIASWEQREPYLHHDCDMNAGSSGGPLLGLNAAAQPVILAINAAHMSPDKVSYVEEFSPSQANIAVPANYFADMIELLKNEAPLAIFRPFYGIDVNRQPSSLWPSASYPTGLLN